MILWFCVIIYFPHFCWCYLKTKISCDRGNIFILCISYLRYLKIPSWLIDLISGFVNFLNPYLATWGNFSFTQKQYNWNLYSHDCVLCWFFPARRVSVLEVCPQRYKEQQLLITTAVTELGTPFQTLPIAQQRKFILLCPIQSCRGSINIYIKKYFISIKHLIFDTCIQLNLPEPQNPCLKHKRWWIHCVNWFVLVVAPILVNMLSGLFAFSLSLIRIKTQPELLY